MFTNKDDQLEFMHLQAKADRLGLYLNYHRTYDPTRDRGGPIYIQTRRRKYADQTIEPVSLAKFISMAEAHRCLDDYAKSRA